MIILKKNISSLKSICQKAVTCCVEGSLGILDSKLLPSRRHDPQGYGGKTKLWGPKLT